MQKPVLIEETMEHASIDFLLHSLITVPKLGHLLYEFSNPVINFIVLGLEDQLEVIIGSFVDFTCILGL